MIIGKKDRKRLKELEEKVEALTARTVQNADQAPTRGWEYLQELGQSFATASGKIVTPETAMKASVVFACTRILSEAMAGLPIHIYKRTENDSRELAPKSAANGLWWLLNESPSPLLTAASWREWMVRDALLYGDGISIIGRKGPYINEIIPVPRQNVIIERKGNRLRYYVSTEEGFFGFDQDDVLHFPGFGFNGVHGMSVISYAARQAIGISLSAEEFAGRFFANGATPGFSIEVPGAISEAQADQLRAEWRKRYSGGDNAHLPLVLAHGAKATQLSLNAEDAQLLQTRMFQVVDICRAFGVPPFMIGETDKTTAWGTGIEHMGLGFVRYSLKGWRSRMEQEMNRKFWPRSMVYFVEHDMDALMSGDSQAEANYFRNALGGAQGPGWMSQNEVRRRKYLPPVPNGDRVFSPEAEVQEGDMNEQT